MRKRAEQASVMADEQIIELYWQRNEMAIQETDKKYGKLLYGIAYNILHNPLDCEECQNDIYLGTWNAIPPARPVAFSAFITRIMRNIAVNRFKEINCKKRIPSELTVSLEEMNSALHGECSAEKEYEAREVGKIINKTKKYFTISCGDNTALDIYELQVPGKRRMLSSDFINGGLSKYID